MKRKNMLSVKLGLAILEYRQLLLCNTYDLEMNAG